MDRLLKTIEEKDQRAFVERVMAMGHESVLEHASFTFLVEGVSRVLLAQLTRHRIASFSVQSQRYVSYAGGFRLHRAPGHPRAGGPMRRRSTMPRWRRCRHGTRGGRSAWAMRGKRAMRTPASCCPGRARHACFLTMNARELRHFFSLRMCSRAQWEIRELAGAMFDLCCREAPALFRDAGPGCLRGACPEGEKSCGKQAQIRKARRDYLEQQGLQ